MLGEDAVLSEYQTFTSNGGTMKNCKKCGIAFKENDMIHRKIGHTKGKTHVYHKKCWERMQY